MRSPIESVTERSLGSQHFLLHQALPRMEQPHSRASLSPPRGSQPPRRPPSPYLESCAEMPYTDILSPEDAPEMVVSAPSRLTTQLITQATAHITSASCPAPPAVVVVPSALPLPPAPILSSPPHPALLTALQEAKL